MSLRAQQSNLHPKGGKLLRRCAPPKKLAVWVASPRASLDDGSIECGKPSSRPGAGLGRAIAKSRNRVGLRRAQSSRGIVKRSLRSLAMADFLCVGPSSRDKPLAMPPEGRFSWTHFRNSAIALPALAMPPRGPALVSSAYPPRSGFATRNDILKRVPLEARRHFPTPGRKRPGRVFTRPVVSGMKYTGFRLNRSIKAVSGTAAFEGGLSGGPRQERCDQEKHHDIVDCHR
jgi:hypothetical protein